MPTEFKVAGVTYRANPDGSIEVKNLNGQWQPWDSSVAASTGTAQAIQQAAQSAQQSAQSAGAAATGGNLAKIAAAQGQGWTVTGKPTPARDDTGAPIPDTYTLVLSGPGGAQRIATVTAPGGQGPTDPRVLAPDTVDWTVVNIAEPIKQGDTQAEKDAAIARAQAEAAAAKALADQRAAELSQLQTDNAQRERNRTSTGYFVTDKERADIEGRGREQGLTQQQIDNQLKIAGDNNAVARAGNEIAATNAATNAFTAQRNAEAQAAQVEAVRRSGDLDAAKFAREQADRDIANRLAEDKLKLDQLQQRQANEIAGGQLDTTQQANVLRGQELEQRTAEAKQTAETAAIGQGAQAAASAYGAERQFQGQAAQTGQSLLQQRATSFQNLSQAPFSQAAQLSQGSAGRFGQLGGGLHAVPEGAVANILQGAMGVSGQLAGGPSALQAAAQAIEQIRPGAAMTPMGQAAAAMIMQVQERARQILQRGQVPAPSTAGPAAPAAAAVPAGAVTAPSTAASLGAVAQPFGQAFQGGQSTGMFGNAPQGLGGPAAFAQSGLAEGSLRAPSTQPTININF
jgi:hypothetical protein